MAGYDDWAPFSWYCPNCGEMVTGFRNAGGTVKIECFRCHVVMVRKVMGRRHDAIDIYAPEGQVHVF